MPPLYVPHLQEAMISSKKHEAPLAQRGVACQGCSWTQLTAQCGDVDVAACVQTGGGPHFLVATHYSCGAIKYLTGSCYNFLL